MYINITNLRLFLATSVMLLSLGVASSFSSVWNEEADVTDFRRIVASAKKEVFPAVVFIRGVVDTHEGGREQGRDISGSGVIVSPEGHVVTNWHVAGKARDLRCQLSDGRAFDAVLLGADQDVDVALLQLQLPEDAAVVPTAKFGDSANLKEGEFVMAMGAPWGLSRSVSIGIISCARRYLPGRSEYSLWLQTDASISPGNSGGPLVNTNGEIIGINTLGYMLGGDIGFAVPSETIKMLLPKLREQGTAGWSWTGLSLQPVRDFVRNIYFEGDSGVIVADVDADSPAAAAGLMAKDRILAVNGKTVAGIYEECLPNLRRMLALLPRDVSAEISVMRGENELQLSVVPREKGEVDGEEISLPRWDFSVKSINQFADPELYFFRDRGVYIYGVRRPGNGQSAGLVRHDIVTEINGREIMSIVDVQEIHTEAMENITDTTRARITVLRNGTPRHFLLDYSRDYSRR